jgi:hypothetical protein
MTIGFVSQAIEVAYSVRRFLVERWRGLLFVLGPALAFIGAIYLLDLLGD